ncbi:MAG: hypothetical protein CMM87_00450 [Rickettsiales bacterium]|nr:hypothetical protein [Rickettsiales bacterium]|tara:strand:+ start:96495 stop:97877 length:1383 start_codon:yes stop_codon:yes gene_type:complete
MSEKHLTKYPTASLPELFTIAGPIILGLLTGSLMNFFDRLFLSHYKVEAMNGAAVGGLISYTFLLIPLSLCAISEVFVGQYNGAGKYHEVGKATGQMILVALAATLVFVPSAFFIAPYFIESSQHTYGVPYMRIFLSGGTLLCLSAALNGFFAGIGKTKISLYASLAGNFVNIIMDPILIFGIGPIPSMGVEGAAYATLLGELAICLILVFSYLKPHFREKFKTLTLAFNMKLMRESVRIGLPSAIGHTIEVLGWSLLFYFSSQQGEIFLTVFVVGQTILIFFIFFTEGLEKGTTAIAANLIGSKQIELIPKLIRSAAKLVGLWLLILLPFMVIYPEIILDVLEIDQARYIYGSELYIHSVWALRYVWLFMLIDSFVWVIVGIMKSAGDTVFIMFANPACAFLFGFIPCVIAMKMDLISPSMQWVFLVFYASMNLLLFIRRYQSGKWKKLDVTKEPQVVV